MEVKVHLVTGEVVKLKAKDKKEALAISKRTIVEGIYQTEVGMFSGLTQKVKATFWSPNQIAKIEFEVEK